MSREPSREHGPSTRQGALEGIVVLELDEGRAHLAGKLLADLGARIIKVEPPDGSAPRRVGPYHGDVVGPDSSLQFWHYNTGKESVVLDLREETDRISFLELVGDVDVVLDGLAFGALDSLHLDPAALIRQNPDLVYCGVTAFGNGGPWRDYASSDLVHLALGGVAAVCGYDEPHDDGPIAPLGGQAANLTGLLTASAILAALYNRDRVGGGQFIDVATHDVLSLSTEMMIPYWEFRQMNGIRQSGRHGRPYLTPRWNHRCRDGKYINALPLYLDNERFAKMVDWFDSEGLAGDLRASEYATDQLRAERMGHIVDVIGEMCAAHDCDDMVSDAQRRRLPWGPINAPDQLVDDVHLQERHAFVYVEHENLGVSLTYPGAPYVLKGTPWSTRRAPLLGEHTEAVVPREKK